ncbi:hypothetical protein VTJ04DRAFT_532 [Mycothermus thermophilus]|uniref:uncharacterized protein n=1 Tax=Humicola insolens TaxID=85995 RepID=UPI0037426E0B
MEQPTTQAQRNTPARRRQKRPVNSPARKNYASENDVPNEVTFPMELGGPLTPRKSAANSPAPQSQSKSQSKPRPPRNNSNNNNNVNGNVNGTGNGHGHGNGNGNGNGGRRGKQPASPAPVKQGRTTPPQSASSKPIAEAAFAGATFHASPAPSSLPIPSFLAKALDSPPSAAGANGRVLREPSPPATDTEAVPTPQHRLLAQAVDRQESPLDIFFRADREEKERARRASSANILGNSTLAFSPPSQVRSPAEPKTVPNGVGIAGNRRAGFQRTPSGGIPASELNGTPSDFIGPALSKPYQERIREALNAKRQPNGAQQPPNLAQQESAMDMTERLKRFLAIPSVTDEQSAPPVQPLSKPLTSGVPPPLTLSNGNQTRPPADLASPFASPGFPPNGAAMPQSPFSPGFAPQGSTIPPPLAPRAAAPASAAASAAAPYLQSSPSRNNHAAEIMRMEESLRRILNLGGAPAATVPPSGYQSS